MGEGLTPHGREEEHAQREQRLDRRRDRRAAEKQLAEGAGTGEEWREPEQDVDGAVKPRLEQDAEEVLLEPRRREDVAVVVREQDAP